MIQARAVGNAVYVEEEGMSGNYCVFALSDHRAASDIAEAINRAIRDAVAEPEEEADALASALGAAESEVERLTKEAKQHAGRAGKAVELANVLAKKRGK